MFYKIKLLIILIVQLAKNLNADTILSGLIERDTLLRLENSPYVAEENVIINKNVRLAIEPGCELRFGKAKQLIVHGTLDARGNLTHRIKFTKLNDDRYNDEDLIRSKISASNAKFRLAEGNTLLDGKLQVYHNSKWNYVCSTQFNWTEIDANVTCKSLGLSNGTFYSYSPSNNLTSNMKIYMPRCNGNERNLFECAGTSNPELGLTVCDNHNLVSLVCEGFDNQMVEDLNFWGGIVFQKYAPYQTVQPFSSVFYNFSKSILEFVDVRYAGLVENKNRFRPNYNYLPGSAITVFQYAPLFNNITVEYSIGNGLNYSNIEAPAIIKGSIFRFNRGHGISAETRFGNITISDTMSHQNGGDGLKYNFNNSIWSQQEQEEYFLSRYLEYCDSQNPLSYPAYYRFRNPNYARECSKTFSTEQDLRITLHFQKVKIKSKYSTYWMEVYDGQTEQNSLIANYTFEDGKTPEAIYSRSNYMFVKLKFLCSYPNDRKLQPIELQKLQQKQQWDQYKAQQLLYEQKLYQFNSLPKSLFAERPWQEDPNQYVAPLSIDQLSQQEQQEQLKLFDKNQKEKQLKFQQQIQIQQQKLQQSRIFCPYSSFDEITMYAMASNLKHPDLLVKNSKFISNSLNGINTTNLHSLIQLNETLISNNQMNGLTVHAGAGDISLYHSKIEFNKMNGINITYAGGLKEFNYTDITNNGFYGIYVNYKVKQEFDNIFQNTTINSSLIESNTLGGVYLGSYCNFSNITVNASVFRNNNENGILIESCRSDDGLDWYQIDPIDRVGPFYKRYIPKLIRYTNLNVSWNTFDSNRLNGLKIESIQNMIGIISNNTFQNHRKGALQITANTSKTNDCLIRNVSIRIMFNKFFNNSGRYALNVAVNELADRKIQSINISFNRFEYNYMYDPYENVLNTRTSKSAVVVVSSSNVAINQNWFNNPRTRIQIGTHLNNYTSIINASYNWFQTVQPVYDLNYFLTNREKCNQQWMIVRNHIFDQANRSNLAQIIYWPYACNEKLWYHESSIDLRPPADFDLMATQSFGGVFDTEATLPVDRYTVVNDILIKPNARLVLKSGTELNFLNGVGMLVLGELIVDGYISSPIRFTLANQQTFALNKATFDRIIVQTTEPPSHLDSYQSLNSNFTNTSSNSESKIEKITYGIELVDGRDSYEGRLKIEINSRSGTVCNRGWTLMNSKIVCQQLGLVVDPNLYLYSIMLNNDHREEEPILMSEVQCDNLDTNLFDCRHTKETDHTCKHQDDVWIRCLKPSWAGVRFGMSSTPSSLRYAIFEHAGQYDYSFGQLAPALQIDLMQHYISNLTFQYNRHTSIEILFNQPFKKSTLNNIELISNYATGLLTRTSFLTINQLYAHDHLTYLAAVEYNPYFSIDLLDSVRLYSSQPRRGYDVRRELTRLNNNLWHIGGEQTVLLYTDVEYNFGPQEMNIQIQTDNNRVLVVDLIDYNPNFDQEKVIFCEKFCQNSLADTNSREWNLSLASNSINFPINTSYSVLHINYNVTNLKSGRLTFLVYSVKAPEPSIDYSNPSYVYIRNIMPENLILIKNSTFRNNRHSIVLKHYDDPNDVFGSLRKRYNYSNIIITNSTFDNNDQVLWLNTDPVVPNTYYQRSTNLTVHLIHSLTESSKDDVLISESGYEMNDLVPSVKTGPLGRINITIEDCVIRNNYGGIRSLYRYHEYSNTLWHYEIRNNRFFNNKQSVIRLILPRIYRFAIKNEWENATHSLNIRNNEFIRNELFEINIDGYYAQMNLTKNIFIENVCRIGLVKLAGTEKDLFIYRNQIEKNQAYFIFDLEAKSHADNDFDIQSQFVENLIEENKRPTRYDDLKKANNNEPVAQQQMSMRDAASILIQNSPSTYTIALRGIQNCTFTQNILQNVQFDYEFVGAISTNTLNSTIDSLMNWWGSQDSTTIKQRIFDIHEWNNHAWVNFVPFCTNRYCDSLSKAQPSYLIEKNLDQFILGGIIEKDLNLARSPMAYQVKADLTIMPGATLYIDAGVEMEFYPNVGILVLGDLKASGTETDMIKMRPVKKSNNRISYYSSISPEIISRSKLSDEVLNDAGFINEFYLNSTKRLRLFDGLNLNEGFLQIYNSTLRSWTWVCDRQFTLITASIVCKQMGKEHRNALIKSLFYYMAPYAQQPIWNQTFICRGGEETLAECDTFANYHLDECKRQGEYTYLMCKDYTLVNDDGFENSWGGIRFSQAYFESYSMQNYIGAPPQAPLFLKPDLQTQEQDDSFMSYVDILGAGQLHNEPNPSIQLVYRTPTIRNCNIRNSTYHGLELIQPRAIATLNKLKVSYSLGYGITSLQLNVQTTDQKSSYMVLSKNTLSNPNIFSMIDMCDPHKYYDIEQRVIVFYKYSNLAKDCIKIFRTRISKTNIGITGQLGVRFMQLMLVNNTVQNDTIEIYNGTLFQQKYLMAGLNNGSVKQDLEKFYLSKTNTLSLYMKASVGREFYGFIAEVLIYPTSQYLSTENYVEVSDSEMSWNQLGAFNYISAGERNPHFYLLRNRFISNGFEYFNTTSESCIDVILQNTPKFYFGNNYILNNYGGLSIKLHSGSGVLITSSIIYNNLFSMNKNDTILSARGELELPYNELTIDKNIFIDNASPRTDIVLVSGLLSKFTRNQFISNKGARILFTQGFENVSTPRYQEIAYNLFRNNYAYGIINDLEDPNRFRSTIVAASLKQTYYANYLNNELNDFELVALVDPLSVAYLLYVFSTSTPGYYWDETVGKFYPNDLKGKLSEYSDNYDSYASTRLNSVKHSGVISYAGSINASYNYWSTSYDTEIRARIRDKYDDPTLFEIEYSPAVLDQFTLRDGKCELGWNLIDDTCYTYVGAYVTYKEAVNVCKKLESRLARETVAPIRLPSFRNLALKSQFNYESQSYRRMWLHKDIVSSSDSSKCSVIEDFGVASAKCNELLPFICEKEPIFVGPSFRFKDELAFAIAAAGALIICIVLLCLLWMYKSRKRKNEHIDRQNTLRNSARTHRHMLNNSNFSTLNSSSILNNKSNNSIYNGIITSSSDNLSISGRNNNNINSGIPGRNLNTIYNSQRNQYFASKKHRQNGDNSTNRLKDLSDKSSENLADSRRFDACGLDSNESNDSYKQGSKSSDDSNISEEANDVNQQTIKADNSVQYHIYDPNTTTKSSGKFYGVTQSGEEETNYGDEDDEDTTTEDTTTDVTTITKQNRPRFKLKEHSPTDLSTKTTETYTENYTNETNRPIGALRPRTPRTTISPPAKQSTPNLSHTHTNQQNQQKTLVNKPRNYNPLSFITSYDQLMNSTITDDEDANSRRLLTNKVNTSNLIQNQQQTTINSSLRKKNLGDSTTNIIMSSNPHFQSESSASNFKTMDKDDSINAPHTNNNLSTFTSGSLLSKSTTNMTNITSLTNVTSSNNSHLQLNAIPSSKSSDYENLSNTALDQIVNDPGQYNQSSLNPSSTPVVITKQNLYSTTSNNLLQVASPRTNLPNLPPLPPPKLLQTQNQYLKLNNPINEDDADSVMSCQLITSASLLLNRDSIREAKQVTDNNQTHQNRIIIPTPRRQAFNSNDQNKNSIQQQYVPPLNPRHFINTQVNQQTQTQQQKNSNIQHSQIDSDVSKPPPMETTI